MNKQQSLALFLMTFGSALNGVSAFGMGAKPPQNTWQCKVLGSQHHVSDTSTHCIPKPGLFDCPPNVSPGHWERRKYFSDYFATEAEAIADAKSRCEQIDYPSDCGEATCQYNP